MLVFYWDVYTLAVHQVHSTVHREGVVNGENKILANLDFRIGMHGCLSGATNVNTVLQLHLRMHTK